MGFTRAYYFEKGWSFYLHNPFFHLKLALFVPMGLLSIFPTIRFARRKPELQAGRAPVVTEAQYKLIARCLGLQMLLLACLLFSASLMVWRGAGRSRLKPAKARRLHALWDRIDWSAA